MQQTVMAELTILVHEWSEEETVEASDKVLSNDLYHAFFYV